MTGKVLSRSHNSYVPLNTTYSGRELAGLRADWGSKACAVTGRWPQDVSKCPNPEAGLWFLEPCEGTARGLLHWVYLWELLERNPK